MPKPQVAFYPDQALLDEMDSYVDEENAQRKAEGGGERFSRSALIEDAVRDYLAAKKGAKKKP